MDFLDSSFYFGGMNLTTVLNSFQGGLAHHELCVHGTSPRLHLLRHPGIPAPPARTAPGACREEGKLRTRAWQKDCRGCTTSKRRRKRNYFAQRNLILRVLRRCRFCCCHLIRVRRFEHRSGEDPRSGGLREGDTGRAPHSGALLTSISLPPSFILNPLEKGP
ncbi:hypothetical protein E5288_WYG012484 [Bos mutus]|uniref:Uncharacterized protein n=1 Tax=Bos mutus TaxID=72004 RepID=A0A6B0R0I1_9CETA|nr:hypothetical protein [Bos mutus]